MLLKPKKTIETDNAGYGVYVWELPNGKHLKDSDGNTLHIGPVWENSPIAIIKLAQAAAECGYPNGKAVYLDGFRTVTDSEWEDQMERLIDGKIPDAADLYRQAVNSGTTG